MSETKEWVSVATSARGETTVSVSMTRGNLSAKYAARAFSTSLKDDVKTVRAGARRNLDALEAALAELDAGG